MARKNLSRFRVGGGMKGKPSRYVYAQSYASIRAMGMTPSDSMVSTVVDRNTGQIVAWPEGHTFSAEGLRHKSGVKEYSVEFLGAAEGEDQATIYAKDDAAAIVLARTIYHPPWKVYEAKTTFRRISE